MQTTKQYDSKDYFIKITIKDSVSFYTKNPHKKALVQIYDYNKKEWLFNDTLKTCFMDYNQNEILNIVYNNITSDMNNFIYNNKY